MPSLPAHQGSANRSPSALSGTSAGEPSWCLQGQAFLIFLAIYSDVAEEVAGLVYKGLGRSRSIGEQILQSRVQLRAMAGQHRQ